MKIGRITVSDRASAGVYEDRSGPEIEAALGEVFSAAAEFVSAIVPDEAELIAAKLREFADTAQCDLVVTTGGTGISVRDVTPEATLAVADKVMQMVPPVRRHDRHRARQHRLHHRPAPAFG
mgnify:CR=1 FL=1